MNLPIKLRTPIVFSVLEYLLLLYFVYLAINFTIESRYLDDFLILLISAFVCFITSNIFYKVTFVYADEIIIYRPTRIFFRYKKISLNDIVYIRYQWNSKAPARITIYLKREAKSRRKYISFRAMNYDKAKQFIIMARKKGIRYKCLPKLLFKNYHLE